MSLEREWRRASLTHCIASPGVSDGASSTLNEGTIRGAPNPRSSSASAPWPTPKTVIPAASPATTPDGAVRERDGVLGPDIEASACREQQLGRRCRTDVLAADEVGIHARLHQPGESGEFEHRQVLALAETTARREPSASRRVEVAMRAGASCDAALKEVAREQPHPCASPALARYPHPAGPSILPSGRRIPRLSRKEWMPSRRERPSMYVR